MSINYVPSLPFMETNEPTLEKWSHCQRKLYNINFTWTLNNFSFLQQAKHESPIFCGGPNDEIKWSVCLSAVIFEWMQAGLKLVAEPINRSKVLGKYTISIINIHGEKTNKIESAGLSEFKLATNENFTNIITKRTLLDEASTLLPNDTLTILCEISFVNGKQEVSGSKGPRNFEIPKCNLADDFGSLIDNPVFSDVTLMVGDYAIPAHKAILSARSPVFAAMFEHYMIETKLNKVDIEDFDPDVFKEMLRFIYTGEANLKGMTEGLLDAADKYSLEKLKVMCEEALFAEISIESAAKILCLSDLHSAKQLKDKTINFVKIHANDVINSEGWKTSMQSKSPLLAETLASIFKSTT